MKPPGRESRPVVGTGSLNVTDGDLLTVPRQHDKIRPPAVVPRVVSIYTTRGGHRLLMIVRCECGWHHQHTAAPTFAEGIRKGGCGRRYVLRVATQVLACLTPEQRTALGLPALAEVMT